MSDPDHHDAQLVALFEDRKLAESARNALLAAGLPHDAIELVDQAGDQVDNHPGDQIGGAAPGFWSALSRLFAPADDAHAFSQAIVAGHVMVVVHPIDAAEREVAIEALEGFGPIDIDERRSAWSPRATIDHQPLAAIPAVSEPAREHMVRIVEERMRIGWRDQTTPPGRVRGYAAAKSNDRQRIELQEDEILNPIPRS